MHNRLSFPMDNVSDGLQNVAYSDFENLPYGTTVNIEFNDLSYDVPDRVQGIKSILKNISGEFRSHELTALMGPSGSGKTTLLNLLAGYRIHETSGIININKKPRNMTVFREMSRYLLQEDHVRPYFTVMESMMFASNLKLDTQLTKQQHIQEIYTILNALHLRNNENTRVSHLSGGQRKRLCIALELLNIPSVLFLDEPTTGLDEFSASQCLRLLKRLVKTGRTIICSIHGPSAKLYDMFDNVYVLAEGQCVYQGSTENSLPYLNNIGLNCPVTYNPADFIIEVAAGEYGNYHENMIRQGNNGKIYKWSPSDIECEQTQIEYLNHTEIEECKLDSNMKNDQCRTSWWLEYRILSKHMLQQMWRDKTYIKLKVIMKLFLTLCISFVYIGIGTDARLFIYNFHLVFITSLTFVFLSMCPMLSHIPLEMNYLRREYFNQWYRLSSYFTALITTQLPDMFVMGIISSAMLYFITDQPVELFRFSLFLLITLLTAMTSSSYALALSSRLNLLNSLFLGPSIISCWVIFANHSVGNPNLSTFETVLMYSGYIRHSVEGLMSALFEFNRTDAICPPDEIFCVLKKPRYLLKLVGFDNLNYTYSIVCLICFYVVFNVLAFINFKCRLSSYSYFEKNRHYQYVKSFIWKYCYFKMY